MSEMIDTQQTVRLRVTRCWDCGRFWGVEAIVGENYAQCPVCAKRRITSTFEEMVKANRRANALRGLLRRKGRR